jgi:hypothetical protein
MTNLDYYLNPEAVPDYLETESANRLRLANLYNKACATSGLFNLDHENGNTTVWKRRHDAPTNIPSQISVSRCYAETLVVTP